MTFAPPPNLRTLATPMQTNSRKNGRNCPGLPYIHNRLRYYLYHMPFVRKDVDNLDRPNFAYYNSFPTVTIKISPNVITYHQINRDVRVRYKQCITRKLCTLALMLKGYSFNTRTGKGGQILPSPHVFCEYLSKYSFDRRDFFNTCPKINGAPFGAKIEDSSILGGLFLGPQSQHFRFSPS